ncbi:tRNA pseudouridine(38-40) synthase TruA [Herbidospora galbida]|uniref:tRNA pseudouridine synthase A n=1 Tax=Herbidospora galbida TaxID=2575442 RepID=A0A4U3MQ43_9ACTN|nr:tRNA pseudouridine(38-40) synthase TruA [Herbidospora galbida]TKK90999.1 tRNA pseudouridine(38-40) synthase TruA [Herbidospora galbida]
MRLRLDLGYDGTDFSGWAKQPGRRTVQGELEAALGRILRLPEPPSLTVAGRTDAGVHARGQVAHVDLADDVEEPAMLLRRLAGVLTPDVRVNRVSVAPPGFDARFSAMSRRYGYRVSDNAGGVDPLRRKDVLWYNRRLDVGLLNAGSAALLGEHDFAAFCKKREGATTIRELQRLSWEQGETFLTATVVADAFCHSMVRALVGSLLMVGDGRQPIEWPGEVLRRAVRDSGVHVAPALGLTLEEVRYPADAELAGRAEMTRRVRTLST